jgi:hypothetical protein
MAMRWTAAAMMEAKKGFRRLKAHKGIVRLMIWDGLWFGVGSGD